MLHAQSDIKGDDRRDNADILPGCAILVLPSVRFLFEPAGPFTVLPYPTTPLEKIGTET